MYYYIDDGKYYCSLIKDLPMQSTKPKDNGELTYLFKKSPRQSRAVFQVDMPGKLSEQAEDVRWLDGKRLDKPKNIPPYVLQLIEKGELQAANVSHPDWKEACKLNLIRSEKVKLNILALGDVGSTLLMGLRLLGGDVLKEIGIFDVRQNTARRWEFEMNQISEPWAYDDYPVVKEIEQDALFDCDVFVFCASRFIPPVGSSVLDVRMAQYDSNAPLIKTYAQKARAYEYKGLFCIVSDPVDPLCKSAFIESNRGDDGAFDGNGLFAEQIKGFGLGVMNARAAYYAKRFDMFSSFLTEGRCFGPHGEGLVVANSIKNYSDTTSIDLTKRVVKANMEMRSMGYKPYVAPALSSGALSILRMLRGEWHYSSTFLGGIFWGAKNKLLKNGSQTETLEAIPDALFERIRESERTLSSIG